MFKIPSKQKPVFFSLSFFVHFSEVKTPDSNVPYIEYPSVTEEKESEEDRSESTVEALSVCGKESKSWAEMTEEASSVELNDLLELDSDNVESSSRSENTDSADKISIQKTKKKLTAEERQKIRDSRKVVSVQHDDECFD